MPLFSEIYNVYFQILKKILLDREGLSAEDLREQISVEGFEERPLYILPKLFSGEWNVLKKEGDLYISRLSDDFYVPLTNLQRSYLKTILQDARMQLFLEKSEIAKIDELLADVPLLWAQDDFYYYDRFTTSDDYSSPAYREHFQALLNAILQGRFVDIEYRSRTGQRVHHHYLPGRLEYSIKNDKFRLLAAKQRTVRSANCPYVQSKSDHRFHLETLNLDRMEQVTVTEKPAPENLDFNALIQKSYYPEPVHILIHNERNALERTMLHFANYEKNTTKLADDLYECFIYYNKNMETELLIEVLSFGPMIEVLGNQVFLSQLKARLWRQRRTRRKRPE